VKSTRKAITPCKRWTTTQSFDSSKHTEAQCFVTETTPLHAAVSSSCGEERGDFGKPWQQRQAQARKFIKAKQYTTRATFTPEAVSENVFLKEHSWHDYSGWFLRLTNGG